MNIKKIFSTFLVLTFIAVSFMLSGFSFFKKKAPIVEKKLIQSYSQTQNDTWCITFQLVWNDFMDKINNGKPIELIGGNPPLADELNKRLYSKDLLSENSYYTKNGKISKKLKREIEKAIYKKFKEKSDVLGYVDWDLKDSYLFYAILKKEFNFLYTFDKLTAQTFNNSVQNVEYFGISKNSDKKLYQNVDILFYNNENDFAVKLNTKNGEDVYLYRTDNENSFEELYKEMKEKRTISADFRKGDLLSIPKLNVDKLISFDELCGKKVKNTKFMISQALQTIKFKLDEKGGSLKSEAIITIMKTSLQPQPKENRYFIFDKPFVLFLQESSKDKPYYAMQVKDTKYLIQQK